MWWRLFALVVLLSIKCVQAGKGGILGSTPIATTTIDLPKEDCTVTPGPLFQDLTGPLPTDTWWIGAGVLPQTADLAGPYPYICAAQNLGVQFGLPNGRYFDGTSIHSPSSKDLYVQAAEISDNITYHKALSFDELSLTIQWFNGSSTLTSYLVQGSAYMTFEYSQATVKILANNGQFTTFNNKTLTTTPQTFTGTKFTVVNANKATYIIYSLSTITINVTRTTILSSGKWTGILRFAAVNTTDSSVLSTLDDSSSVYATSAAISYEVEGDVGYLNYTWTVPSGNSSKLLLMAWIHHRNVLQNANLVSNFKFLTVKGYQVGVLGSTWILKYDLPTVSWFAPRSFDSSCVNITNDALTNDVNALTILTPNDFYRFGGNFAANAKLALIAEELGRFDLIPQILNILKRSYDPWFNGTGGNPAAYDPLWGGVISSLTDEFGNQIYNDHHFHYGYHLFGTAVIGKYDPEWFSTNINWFTQMARDIGNPSSSDPSFTVVRHRDWFAGHSWASGIANGAGSRDEESSTEGINGYYGLYTYALVAENCELQDFARLLIATEVQSVQAYWHLYPEATTETAYPEQVFRDFTTVGNVEDQQAGPWLFWGAEKLEISGIQMLPFTAITGELIIDEAWGRVSYTYTSVEFNDSTVGGDWKNLMYMAHAIWDPVSAFTEALTTTTWGSGNSYSNSLWFIATRASTTASGVAGKVCTGAPVTGATLQQGLLYSVSTGLYVAVGAYNYAYANYDLAGATVFNFVSAQGTQLQDNSTGYFASADSSGTAAIIVNRATASSWETYTFYQIGDYFVIRALANSLYLGVADGSSHEIFNNLTYASASDVPVTGRFKLVCPGGSTTCAKAVKAYYPYSANNASIVQSPANTANCGKIVSSSTTGSTGNTGSTGAGVSTTSESIKPSSSASKNGLHVMLCVVAFILSLLL